MKRSKPNRKLNIWVARSVPCFLLGIIGYVLWVTTKLVCVDYLLRPSPSDFSSVQRGSAVAILTILYILLLFLLISYGRLLDVVTRKPGLVPRGRQWYIERQQTQPSPHGEEKDRKVNSHKSTPASAQAESVDVDERVIKDLEFWQRDVFTCKHDGRPQFCSSCYNWKPDRAHHCSELNRCVLKMDHFCPWVGGVVGESSFKFFIQFTFWAGLMCLHILVSIAYFLAQRQQRSGSINAHWAVALGLAGLFFLFSGGMCLSSLQFAFINSTTIENLDKTGKQWCLAIHIPDDRIEHVRDSNGSDLRLITYPRPISEQLRMIEQVKSKLAADASGTAIQQPNQTESPEDVPPVGERRTFGIFYTERGDNPWSLGLLGNFEDIMGHTIWDWLLPIKPSPCANHDSLQAFYKTGAAVDRIKLDAGIVSKHQNSTKERQRRRRHRSKGSRTSRKG